VKRIGKEVVVVYFKLR